METNDVCSVCIEPFNLKIKLECSHSFCKECIYRWMVKNFTCPICRSVINDKKDFIEYAIENRIYVRMKKYAIKLDLNEDDLEMLSLVGIYVGAYMNKKLWMELMRNNIIADIVRKLDLNINYISIISRVQPSRYDYFKQNNEIYYFV